MLANALLTSAVLATASSAAVLQARDGAAATTSPATAFRLVATVTDFDWSPSLSGTEVSFNVTEGGGCRANLILTRPSSAEGRKGAIFFDTDAGVHAYNFPGVDGTSGVVAEGSGTATVPGVNEVHLDCDAGAATPGIVLDPTVGLTYDQGAWMACPSALLNLGGPDLTVLSYKEAGQRTLAGCANVQLKPVCDAPAKPADGAKPVACQEQ